MLTAELLAPIATGVIDSAALILPTGLTIMGCVIGITMIPKLIYKFL